MESTPSPTPPSPAQPALEKNHVNLRMTYLVMGNPRPPHSLGNIHLNTTIQQLKEKIQSELPEHPAPAEQRLIYQGRPLLRNDATLRDVLRLEVMWTVISGSASLNARLAWTRIRSAASHDPYCHPESPDCSSTSALPEPAPPSATASSTSHASASRRHQPISSGRGLRKQVAKRACPHTTAD